MSSGITKLIVNGPYQEPQQYWHYNREKGRFQLENGRRPAGYTIATPGFRGFNDPGQFIPIDLVNQIRKRVDAWREENYPGVTGITKRLLEHWTSENTRESHRLFFCQLEAIETLIWLTEGSDKAGIEVPGDGGPFPRWCSKMATGSGKTVVMAMVIAWNFLNKAAYPADSRFSKDALIVAPGLTVKNRLQVLQPEHPANYFAAFDIVPASLREKLHQGKVLIHNWHTLSWDTQEKINARVKKGSLRSVDKRKRIEISRTAYAAEVLGDMANAKNIIVINDEAHHAWRSNLPAHKKYTRVGSQKDTDEATIWVGGLDRIHAHVKILRCFDLSATPFSPSGKRTEEEALFPWIISDFSLNDAIESGLVKTPRVAVRDDSGEITPEYRSRLYHIYRDKTVKDDLNRRSVSEESPLPDLIRTAYNLLGADWLATKRSWKKLGHEIPPVMITVTNNTKTAARIRHAFANQQINVEELCDSKKILQIDSKILEDAEIEREDMPKNKQEQAKQLRDQVDTVGQKGKPGEQFQNVISVDMLSEGWDAKTVTHIMGLRAFTSQLLCEQVVGRGLRRVSYDVDEETGRFKPEHVNIFGVPFTFLPHEEDSDEPPPPPPPKTAIQPVLEKADHEISWPNVIRVEREYRSELSLAVDSAQVLEIDPSKSITKAKLDGIIDGVPHPAEEAEIGFSEVAKDTRRQTVIFKIAAEFYRSNPIPGWKSGEGAFLAQLVSLVEKLIDAGKVVIKSSLGDLDETRRKIVLIFNMNRIITHFWSEIQKLNTSRLNPIFDTERPVTSTANIPVWYTSKPYQWSNKSHINYSVFDSQWEQTADSVIDRTPEVDSFFKNNRHGLSVHYTYNGVVRRYIPDFIIKLTNGELLVLEIKGQDDPQVQAKKDALDEWIEAVNEHGGFGIWHSGIAFELREVPRIIADAIASSNKASNGEKTLD